MKNQNRKPEDAARLRKKAEELLKLRKSETKINVSEADMLKMIHELQVHQIELEMQNEELLIAQERIKELAKEKYKELYDFATSGYLTISKEGKILELNFAAAHMLGKERSKLINSRFALFISQETRSDFNLFVQKVFTSNTKQSCQVVIATEGDPVLAGKVLPIYVNMDGLLSQNAEFCQLTLADITERKLNESLLSSRLHLKEFSEKHSLDELLEETLNEAEKLTGSQIGFYHFVEEEQKSLTLQNWSTQTKAKFCKTEAKGMHYDIAKAGVWVECFYKRKPVIHNDYASLPNQKGLPEGHAEVIRQLVVPVLRQDKIIAILGVGNKLTDYTDQDVQIVSVLADMAWDTFERKRAEEKLQQSEHQYKDLTERLKEVIYTADLETFASVFVNTAIEKATGYSQAEWLADPYLWENLLHDEDKEQTFREIAESGKRGTNNVMTYRIFHRDGGVRWMEDHVFWTKDESGKVVGMNGIMYDITERKHKEEALQKSEERLELFFSQSLDGFFFMMLDEPVVWNDNIDKDNTLDYVFEYQRITKVNDAMLAQYLAKSEQFIGLTPKDLFAHDIEYGKKVWCEFFDKGQLHIDTNERRFDGSQMWIEGDYICLYDSEKRITGHFGIQRDVTEYKQAEEDLIESKNYNRMLFDQSIIGLALTSMDGQLIDVNPAFCKIIGRTIDDTLQLTYWDITPEKYAEEEQLQLQSLNSFGEYGPYEKEYIHKDGSLIPVRLQGKIIERYGAKYIWSSVEDITERKRAQEALQASEERFRAIASNTPDHILVQDRQLRYTFVANPQLGLREEDMIGKTDYDLLSREEADKLASMKTKVMETGNPLSFETPLVSLTGNTEYFEGNYVPKYNPQGQVDGLIGYFRNVTERKQAEEVLLREKEFLDAIFDSIEEGIVACNADGVLTRFNRSTREFYGIPQEEIPANQWANHYDLYLPDGKTAMRKEDIPLFRALKDRRVHNQEMMIIPKQGLPRTFVVNGKSLRDKDGKTLGAVVAMHDITERKQAEEKLSQSECRLHEAQRIAHIGSWEWNIRTGETRWSPENYAIHGMSQDSPTLTPDTLIKFVHPDDLERVKTTISQVISEGKPVTIEYRVFRPDGTIRVIHARGMICGFDVEGRPELMVGTNQDITDRVEKEKQLRKLTNRLIEAEEFMKKNAAKQLHDQVGQNLTALSLNLNYLPLLLSEESREKIKDRINDSLSILEQTIEQTRDIMSDLRPSVLDDYGLNAALKWSVEIFARRTGIEVNYSGKDLDNVLPMPVKYAFFRAVQEAMHNIVKHSGASKVSIVLSQTEDMTTLVVRDNGKGFDLAEIIAREKVQGWGIAGMEERIKLVGGDFNVISAPGMGTEIRMSIQKQQ